MQSRYRITVNGIVQGVGFRPFMYKLAKRYQLAGWVANATNGVIVEIEGSDEACQQLIDNIEKQAPELARIDKVTAQKIIPQNEKNFTIKESLPGERKTLISPDMGICEQCYADICDPNNRRYGYAFTNCTSCGPRFSIIKDLPYDRALTTMAAFRQCRKCQAEFDNPLDRRFHAQPNACADCGPQLSYWDAAGNALPGDALAQAKADIAAGKIIAVKGIGGYHLVCDALNQFAVATLRQRKHRYDKPFAVMMADLDTVREYCHCSPEEEQLLTSQRRPIVLLTKKDSAAKIADQVAPENSRLGVMLPYTPLHYLICSGFDVLVMTSANLSDEPIVYDDQEMSARLSTITDAVLTHNRPIFRRCDDSVMVSSRYGPLFLRRSRGFAPEPITIADCGQNVLAVGAEQKNTFCLTRQDEAIISQHIGELDNHGTYQSYQQEIAYFIKMFDAKPQVIAYDMHPNYLSSHYALAQDSSLLKIPVQHHHAHFASVLAEHKIEEPALALIYDGTGFGLDNSLWGGEVLLGDMCSFERKAHLLPLALPGGEQAIHQPWRQAMSVLVAAFGPDKLSEHAPPGLLKQGWQTLLQAMLAGINAPLSSGMGRLFDAVTALLGIGEYVNYEGQAAVALEQAIVADAEGKAYSFAINKEQSAYLIDWRHLIKQVVDDMASGVDKGIIAGRFHRAVVVMSLQIALLLREETGINIVAFSGGCWQNIYLLNNTYQSLQAAGFKVYFNQKVPINDGGIAYGQAAVAAAKISKGEI